MDGWRNKRLASRAPAVMTVLQSLANHYQARLLVGGQLVQW